MYQDMYNFMIDFVLFNVMLEYIVPSNGARRHHCRSWRCLLLGAHDLRTWIEGHFSCTTSCDRGPLSMWFYSKDRGASNVDLILFFCLFFCLSRWRKPTLPV